MALPFWSTSPQVWLELLAIDSPKPLRLTYTATLLIEQDYRGEADGTTLAQRSRRRSRRRSSLLKVSFSPRGSLPIAGASIGMADDGLGFTIATTATPGDGAKAQIYALRALSSSARDSWVSHLRAWGAVGEKSS